MKNHGHVFVYGTLKEGGYYSKSFDEERVSAKPAKLTGATMFDLGHFPGIVIDGVGTVRGELHLYKEFTDVVRRFDRIEGHRKRNHDGNLYNKHVVEVETEDGEKVKAMVYTLNTHRISVEGREKVEDGTWQIDRKEG